MPAQVGFKKFGERALSCMLIELGQLDKGAVEGKPVTGKIAETLAKKILEESGKAPTYGFGRI